MAEGYQTEEEQIEALKKWWRENGKSTLVSIVVAVALVFGWQGYQKQRQAAVESASVIFQNIVTAANASNGQPTEKQIATASHLAETLIKDYPDSTYAQFAALYKAQFAVDDNKLEEAEKQLRWVLERASMPEILLQTRLRLARVLYARDEFDQALDQLQGDAAGYAAGYEEVRGDIYRAKGEEEKALAAYEKADKLNSEAASPVNNPLLKIKLQHQRSVVGSQPDKVAGA